jgi:hypothetical protein
LVVGYWDATGVVIGLHIIPVSGVVYTVPTGNLIIDMLDIKNAEADTNNRSLDRCNVWGLGNTGNDLALGIEAIHQSFDQSTYIQAN